MKNTELNFISFLFNDGEIQTCFKDNIVTFIDNDGNLLVAVYPGNMRNFLKILTVLDIPDNTALCNIPTAAAAALNFIK